MKLNTANELLTVGELKNILKNVPDETHLRYRRVNITTGLDKSSPIHKVDASSSILFLVTEYIEQASLDSYGSVNDGNTN